ncbi:MAG: hypothetical protein ABIP89_13800 [Polyangiaceae bacterium]
MSDSRPPQTTCFDCGKEAPPGDEHTPLISIKFGWRLVRGVDAAGKPIGQWRCPECWTTFKQFHHAVSPTVGVPIFRPSSVTPPPRKKT